MGQNLEKTLTLSFADLKAHPERITDMLSAHESIPILLEKRGDTVSMGAVPRYSKETDRLLEEALAEYAEMKRRGYSREDGFAEIEAVRRELADRADE
jgi:hypothetical protein